MMEQNVVLGSEYLELAKAHRHVLHAYPELSGAEFATRDYVVKTLRALGLRPEIYGTSVVADVRGAQKKRVAFRADIDALPVTEQTELPWRSTVDGVMHACGHDGHTAILLAFAKYLTDKKPPCSVRLIFQAAEEKGGGADGLVQQGVLDGVERIFGLHLDPHSDFGSLSSIEGGMFAGNCDFRVRWEGKGCHVAELEHGTEPLHAAVRFYTEANALFQSRYASKNKFGLCTLKSGSTHNVIETTAYLSGSFRCYDVAYREAFFVELAQVMANITRDTGVEHYFEAIAAYEPLLNTPEVVTAARRVLPLNTCAPRYVSEDFAYYLKAVDGMFFWLGVRDEAHRSPLHSPTFDFDESVFQVGLEAFATLLNAFANDLV